MKTIVIGLGNPILGDDGVGWKVAGEVRDQLPPDSHADVECLSLGGISLMEHLIGYEHAILIDAFALDEPTGSILILKLDDLPNYSAFHTTSTHDTSLQKAIEMGRSLGAQLPGDVTVVGIATKRVYDFSEELSPPVADAVPLAAKFVLDMLGEKMKSEN
ncbi:MAG: hydrogenase maturation protease [Anaerolineaceae bacterium]|jgi:hydrogenase maturation protease|nr:MAG: hydrogenase maturation protease [Anaerolineaceae bacterium]